MRLVIMPRDPAEPDAAVLDELKARFPGWQIWVSGPTWCARPAPLINCGGPEELAERIETAHSQPPDGSPSLASLQEYEARLMQFREYEEAAGDAWRHMRAEMDAGVAAAMADPVARFYQRHGYPAEREAPPTARPAAAATGDGEPGPA